MKQIFGILTVSVFLSVSVVCGTMALIKYL